MSLATRNVTPIFPNLSKGLSIIIPAAGEGTRMKAYGIKSLIPLNTTTNIIEHQLKTIFKVFNRKTTEVILVTGFQSLKLMNNTPDDLLKVENERYLETNVIRSLGMGLRVAKHSAVLVIYGDLVFNIHALTTDLQKSTLMIDKNTMGENEVGCTIDNERIENVLYNLPNKWAQIGYFVGKELALLKQFCWHPSNERKFGFEAINHIIEKKGKFLAKQPNQIKVNDVDSPKDLEVAQAILK